LDSLHTAEGIVLTPLHPLKLLWFLQYQLLLEYLSEGSIKAPRSVDKQVLRIVHSINYPAFTPDLSGQLQVNTSQLDLLWSGFSAEPNAYQSIRSSAQLGVSALSESQYQAIDSRRIREKIQEYLELNPHIRQVRVGVINPGDAENFLQAAREIHLALNKTRELRYDFRFYGKERIEDLASSFDRLMTEEDERRRKEVDDELLEAAGNLMAPKLVYSKHAQEELIRSEDNPADECHLLFAIDCFDVKLATIERVPENSGSFLGNLVNDYVSVFEVSGERASWTHTIVPQLEFEIEVLSVLGCLMKECLEVFMHASALLASGKQTPWPCVVLEIGKEEKKLINAAHRLADWVAFVDKHFGVDFIDHPSSPFCEYYLVDYCPSPKEGVGHKLIVSTASEEGLRRAVVGALESLGLPRESAPEVFSGLQAISGRLLIKLLTSRNFAKEAISIVLLWLLSKEKGELATKIFVPIDPHQELVSGTEGETGYRTDAALVSIAPKSKQVQIDLVETKIRSALQIQEILDLKDKITKQVEQTQWNLTSILSKLGPANLLHNSHYRKALQDILRFYLDRGLRHNLISSAGYDALVKGLDSLRQWELSIDVSKSGYIFNLGRPDSYEERGPGGITFHLIGKDKILQLLAAEEAPAPLKAEVGAPTPPEAGIKVTVEEVVPTTVEKVVKAPAQEERITAATAISVYLGKDLVSGRQLFWEPAKELPRKLTNPHILIVGTSGSGKTQTTMALLYEMWRQGVPSLILDFHGEYADPKMGKFRSQTSAQVVDALAGLPVNPLDVPFDAWGKPHNYKRTVWEVSEIIGNIFRLGLQQQRALKRAMEMAYQLAGFSSDSSTWNRRAPRFSQLKEILESQTDERGGVITGLLSRLDVLFDVEIFSERAPNRFEDLISKVTAVDLSRLFNDEHRLVVARFFLQKVYNHMLLQGESRELKLFVVVDEAHRLSYDETLLRLIREARKYGVGILLSSQEPSDFPTTAIELPGTKFFLQQGPRGSRALGSHLEPSEAKRRVQMEEELQKLEVGQAFIRNDHFLPYVKARIQLFYERVYKQGMRIGKGHPASQF